MSAGSEIPILAHAFVPSLLAERDLTLQLETVVSAVRAQAAVDQAAEIMTGDYAPLAHLLLRAEGVASSFIEGVTAPVVDIVLAEAGEQMAPSAAAWVAANLAAVTGRSTRRMAGLLP